MPTLRGCRFLTISCPLKTLPRSFFPLVTQWRQQQLTFLLLLLALGLHVFCRRSGQVLKVMGGGLLTGHKFSKIPTLTTELQKPIWTCSILTLLGYLMKWRRLTLAVSVSKQASPE